MGLLFSQPVFIFVLIILIILFIFGVVITATTPPTMNNHTPLVGLYTAALGNEGVDPNLWTDQIPYTRIGDQIIITTGSHWNVSSATPLTNTTIPIQFILPTTSKNVMLYYTSTSGISFTAPAAGLVGVQYSPSTVAFVYADSSSTPLSPTRYFTGANITYNTTQVIGFVLTYTVV